MEHLNRNNHSFAVVVYEESDNKWLRDMKLKLGHANLLD